MLVDRKYYEIEKKELLIENDRLLEQIMSQDNMCTAMHSYDDIVKYFDMETGYVEEYTKCLELKAELSKRKDMVEKEVYNELSKSFSKLKKHCISFEISVQQSKESFQNDKPCNNQDAPEVCEFFEINELKAQLQAKNTTINNMKKHIENLKGKSVSNCIDPVNNSKVIAPEMFKLDLQPLSYNLKKNREAHVDYSKITKEHADTLREIVDQARAFEKLVVVIPTNRTRQVTFEKTRGISETYTQKYVDSHPNQNTNRPFLPSTRVKSSTNASGSQPRSNTRNNRILRPSSSNKKNKIVEVHHRNVKSSLNNTNRVSVCNENTKHAVLNENYEFMCSTCNECMFSANHDMPVVDYLNDVNMHATAKSKSIKKNEWKSTGKVFTNVGHKWLTTERTFTIVGNKCPLIRITSTKIVPPRKSIQTNVITYIPPLKVVQIILWYLDLGCSKHMTGQCTQLINFVKKLIGTVRFGNDHFATIMGYGYYHIGNVTISRVYYVEGLGHKLFSVGQFCDSDLEVAFQKNSCFVRNLDGVDLLKGSRGINLYTISLKDMLKSSLIFLLPKASKTKSWLWHRSLSHLKKKVQVSLNATVRFIRTDNGTEFVNLTLKSYYEDVRITHQTSVTRTPQQNVVVKRRNRTLVEVARTMLIFSKASLFLWAEAVATAYLKYLHVFGALCYPTNDSEDLGKLKSKADIGIFIGCSPAKKASGLVPNSVSSTPYVPPSKKDRDILFQPMFDEYFNPPTSLVSP
ncbi:integrase, catalytic region, zinc finger, CCHC-type containing protein [Tanacetum coccineum]